jgi:TonB family protein
VRLSITLLWCVLAFGQTAPIPPAEQKVPNQDFGLTVGTDGRPVGTIDILSDTGGVDFAPYLDRILSMIRQNWVRLIPESARMGKKGKLAIEIAITKAGQVAEMKLVATSDDTVLDRAAWSAIVQSNPFPPLPSEFTGPFIAMRLRFYNKLQIEHRVRSTFNESDHLSRQQR